MHHFSSVQFSCSIFSDTLRPHELQHQASLSITNSLSLPKLTSIESVMPSNRLILCRSFPLALNLSSIRVFSNESTLRISWPKYWSFSISLSKEYSGLISFRIDWFELLAVWGTRKSLPQHHNSKASIRHWSNTSLWSNSHIPTLTTGENIALTTQTFVLKVMFLLFNMLARFVIAFLPRSKHLLISWLQSPSTVILEPPIIKSVTVSIFTTAIYHEMMGLDAMILVF